jgi:hypothetical protein
LSSVAFSVIGPVVPASPIQMPNALTACANVKVDVSGELKNTPRAPSWARADVQPNNAGQWLAIFRLPYGSKIAADGAALRCVL